MKKRLIGLMTFLLPIPLFLNSTCIIIYKIKNNIYVVADTKSVITNLTPNTKTQYAATINKIHNKGKYYYAISGHDDATLLKIATNSIDTLKSLSYCVTRFGIKMKIYYEASLKKEKSISKIDYERFLTDKLADVSFFSSNNKEAKLYTILLTMKEANGIPLVDFKIDSTSNIMVLGFHDHIEKLSQYEMKKLMEQDIFGFLESLLHIELEKHRDHIGCPLDEFSLLNGVPSLIRKNCD